MEVSSATLPASLFLALSLERKAPPVPWRHGTAPPPLCAGTGGLAGTAAAGRCRRGRGRRSAATPSRPGEVPRTLPAPAERAGAKMFILSWKMGC